MTVSGKSRTFAASATNDLREWKNLGARLERIFGIPKGLTPDEIGDEMRKVAVRCAEAIDAAHDEAEAL